MRLSWPNGIPQGRSLCLQDGGLQPELSCMKKATLRMRVHLEVAQILVTAVRMRVLVNISTVRCLSQFTLNMFQWNWLGCAQEEQDSLPAKVRIWNDQLQNSSYSKLFHHGQSFSFQDSKCMRCLSKTADWSHATSWLTIWTRCPNETNAQGCNPRPFAWKTKRVAESILFELQIQCAHLSHVNHIRPP